MAKSKFNCTTYLPVLALVVLFLYFTYKKESAEGAVVENMSDNVAIGLTIGAMIFLFVICLYAGVSCVSIFFAL